MNKLKQIEKIIDNISANIINSDCCYSCKRKLFCKGYHCNFIPLFNACREHKKLLEAFWEIQDILEDE